MASPLRQKLSSLAASALSMPGSNNRSMQPIPVPPGDFVSFETGGMGNFPYYYTDPSNLQFNALTYNWINTSLLNNIAPIKQGSGLFTNYFLTALSKVVYSLSTADQAMLNTARATTLNEQAALLEQWKQIFGSIPPISGNMQPIDQIMSTVCSDWAQPPTTIMAILAAPDAEELLNHIPQVAQPLVPYLISYLKALKGGAVLLNDTALNNGYLRRALAALQYPSGDNGGVVANNNMTYPAYQILTPLQDIIAGLSDQTKGISVEITVSKLSNGQISVNMDGMDAFAMAPDDLLSIALDDEPNYFATLVAGTDSPIQMQLLFDGLTLVQLEPAAFDKGSGQNWYWPEAITEAVLNGTKDVTGFKFSPQPGLDFTGKGPFGFISAMAISNQPTVRFSADNLDSDTVHTKVQASSVAQVMVLNSPLIPSQRPLNVTNNANGLEYSIPQKALGAVILRPSPTIAAAIPTIQDVAWVHGVVTVFPVIETHS